MSAPYSYAAEPTVADPALSDLLAALAASQAARAAEMDVPLGGGYRLTLLGRPGLVGRTAVVVWAGPYGLRPLDCGVAASAEAALSWAYTAARTHALDALTPAGEARP